MNAAILLPLLMILICTATLYGCYVAFDRLQTRIEQTHGRARWMPILLAGGIGLVALLTFWCCFTFSVGLMQALGLNL